MNEILILEGEIDSLKKAFKLLEDIYPLCELYKLLDFIKVKEAELLNLQNMSE